MSKSVSWGGIGKGDKMGNLVLLIKTVQRV